MQFSALIKRHKHVDAFSFLAFECGNYYSTSKNVDPCVCDSKNNSLARNQHTPIRYNITSTDRCFIMVSVS